MKDNMIFENRMITPGTKQDAVVYLRETFCQTVTKLSPPENTTSYKIAAHV